MKINILGSKDTEAYKLVELAISKKGHTITDIESSDIAVAPLLTEIIPFDKLSEPTYGTLIFHPSALPYGRGAASIKHAYKKHEPITAATWFWANNGKVDSGDICEMEILKINYDQRPRIFYQTHVLPAMLRTLERCINSLNNGVVRRIPQVDEYASFDYKQ